MGNNKEIIGLNIALKRRFSKFNGDDTGLSEYIVFGNYDSMDINVVRNWYDFSPEFINSDNKNNKSEFLDIYYIKLLFPSNRTISTLSNMGADYDFWNGIDTKNELMKHFFGLWLLSFPKEVVQSLKNNYLPEEYLFNELRKCYKKNNPQVSDEDVNNFFRKIHLSEYTTLGYFDIAVLFNANDLSEILTLINTLKDAPISINSSLIIAQRSVYTPIKQKFLPSDNKDVTLSIRIKVDPGASMQECAKELIKYFKGQYAINFVYGNSDLILFPDLPINELVDEFLTNGFFNSGSEFMNKYVRNIHSTIKMNKGLNKDLIINSISTNSHMPHNEIYDLEKKLSSYNEFQKQKGLSGRLVSGWKELFNLYKESTTYSFTFDIKSIMQKSLATTFYCIDMFICDYEHDSDKYNYNILFEFENAVSDLKNYFSDYLKSISFSDLHLMDGSAYPHPAGIFATKLLFAYNQIARKLSSFVTKNDKETTDETEYSFLVISGNCDETSIIDPFYFCDAKISNDENKLNEKKPFVIKIPENNLYFIKATIFHLFHECLHHCGNRKRKERAELMLEFVCYTISNIISRFVVFNQEDLLKKLRVADNCGNDFPDSNIVFKIRDKYISKLSNEIYKILIKEPKKYIQQKEYHEYLLQRIKLDIFSVVSQTISSEGIKKQSNTFIEKVYKKAMYYSAELLKEIKAALYNGQQTFTKIDLEISKIDYELQNHNRLVAKGEIYNRLYCVINVINQNVFDFELLDNKGKEDKDYYKELSFISENCTIEEITTLTVEGFKECYSDIASIILLNLSIEDYLLSFIADNNNSKEVFVNSSYNTLRIASVLKNMYDITDYSKLEQYKQSVKDKYEEFHYIKDISFDEVWLDLNKMVFDYEDEEKCKALDKYIQLIRQEYKNYNLDDYMSGIVSLFNDLNSNTNTEVLTNFIYRFWGELSNE